MKNISVGESDFKDLITKDALFIDKSLFIEDIVKDINKVKPF